MLFKIGENKMLVRIGDHKMLVRIGDHKMLVRIANRKDSDQTCLIWSVLFVYNRPF